MIAEKLRIFRKVGAVNTLDSLLAAHVVPHRLSVPQLRADNAETVDVALFRAAKVAAAKNFRRGPQER